jgi:hypothetical protein
MNTTAYARARLNQRTPDRSDGASHYRHLRRYVVKSLPSSVASFWRPMPRRRRYYGGHRHLPVANALAGITRSDF